MDNPIDKLLHRLERCISTGVYEQLETDKYEIKDNSHNATDWKELYRSANALLNTRGGLIIVGVKEDVTNKKYVFTGFDARNEEKIKQIKDQFTDAAGRPVNVEQCIQGYEIRDFMSGQLLLIYIDELPEEQKYIYYAGKAYERILTGDHVITPHKAEQHEELKNHMRDARELTKVAGATIDDLDLEKLNYYIFLLNKIRKTETVKTSIADARSFLVRRMMLRDDQPTMLGMLTCGREPEVFLFNRCQIDCYVDLPQKDIVTKARRTLVDTVIGLMEEAQQFILQHIEVGISVEKGGSPIYEYPLELIRESVNNALAHRDYNIDRFTTIRVVPKVHIEIRNPGRFKPQLIIQHNLHGKQPVRRLVQGGPAASNPRLAAVLHVFDKWEGQGIGMSTLTEACLNNEVDLPYYIFHSKDELSLVIPSGKLIDAGMELLFESFAGYLKDKLGAPPDEGQKKVLAYLYKSEQANKLSRFTILLNQNNNHLRAIRALLDAGLITPGEAGDDIHPVYLLDPQLFRQDFHMELKELFGTRLEQLKPEHTEILHLLYEAYYYGTDKQLSANRAGDMLWMRAGKHNVVEGFEAFKRRIRYAMARLEKDGLIKRADGKGKYMLHVGA